MTTPHDVFDPGDGWRRASHEEWVEADVSLALNERGGGVTYWVREAPVPPLPTEPYTVIRVEWKEGLRRDARELVRWSATWESEDNLLAPEELANRITGFEVLAEPCSQHYGHEDIEEARRETAQAVLDRALEEHARDENGWHDRVAREFGVSS